MRAYSKVVDWRMAFPDALDVLRSTSTPDAPETITAAIQMFLNDFMKATYKNS